MNQEPTFRIFDMEIEQRAVIGIATLAGLLVLAWIIGPVAMVLTWLIQHWAASESWRARSRWGSVAGFACFFGIVALILFVGTYISVPVLTPWIAFIWEHLPASWNTTIRLTIIRWGTLLGLAPGLAIPLEYFHPRTIWYPPVRDVLEAERRQLEEKTRKKQETARIRAEQAARKKAQPTASTQAPQHPTTAHDQLVTTVTAPSAQDADQVPTDPGQPTVPTNPEKQQPGTPAPQRLATPPVPEQRTTPVPEPPTPKKRNWDQGDGSLKDL